MLGVDFAAEMLDIAREHVASRRLRKVELREGDMTALGLRSHSFDAVICVLGMFFVDIAGETRALSNLLRPASGRSGMPDVDITSATDRLALPSANDWWRIVLGTGLRRTISSLEPSKTEAVRARCDQYVHDHDMRDLVVDTHLALAR